MSNQNAASNWLGLLRWSMSHSDQTDPSTFTAMSDEDRQWLERVMKEAVRDDPQRMEEVMTRLRDVTESRGSFEGLHFELEELRDIVEQVDMAMVFVKFGGCNIIVRFVEECGSLIDDSLRSLAIAIIATVAQNHLNAQDLLMKGGIIDKLVSLFLSSTSSLFSTKLLFALSCTVRGHPVAEEYFVMKFSDLVFSKSLNSRHPSIVSRAAFFANALIVSDYCSTNRIAKLALVFIPACFEFLNEETAVDCRENVFQLLRSFLQSSAGFVLISNTYRSEFQEVLNEREQLIDSASTESLSPEEKEHERRAVVEMRQKMLLFDEQYPSPVAKDNALKATSDASESLHQRYSLESTLQQINRQSSSANDNNDDSTNERRNRDRDGGPSRDQPRNDHDDRSTNNNSDDRSRSTVLLIAPPQPEASSPTP